MLAAERLTRNDINTIWDDRVLNRAYDLFGGVPGINLVDSNESVPPETKQRLAAAVLLPQEVA